MASIPNTYSESAADAGGATQASLDEKVGRLAAESLPLAIEILKEAMRIPADYVDKLAAEGGDDHCGLSNHEGPRLEYLKKRIIEIGAVDSSDDVSFDAFGNLHWIVQDPNDGIAPEDKTVIYFDGHTDTVQALRHRWREAIGGIDAYDGLRAGEDSGSGDGDGREIDAGFLRSELGYLPPEDEWGHLLWGRGSADQLGGVICQILATRLMLALRDEGLLRGVIVHSYGTVAEEDNDGGGPMYIMRHELPGAPPERMPDVLILTEGTGCAETGALGLYRGQRGRMQIEVEVTGKSCHGSMPHEGRNPLEWGGRILAEAAERQASGEGFLDDPFLGKGTRTASLANLETPSDCAVPERFTFRFDRRLTAGEDPEQAIADVESLEAVQRARKDGLEVTIQTPVYKRLTWRGYEPGNAQIYPGWVTPEEHPAISTAVETYRRVISPQVAEGGEGGALRKEPRVSRWVFSTDGVGVPVEQDALDVPDTKNWVSSGRFKYPAMFGIGPGIEQNTHKVGECVDTRELAPVIAFYARFPRLYHDQQNS